jgi:hypothetical protein
MLNPVQCVSGQRETGHQGRERDACAAQDRQVHRDACVILTTTLTTTAQPPVHRIGRLSAGAPLPEPVLEAFREGLRELGLRPFMKKSRHSSRSKMRVPISPALRGDHFGSVRDLDFHP